MSSRQPRDGNAPPFLPRQHLTTPLFASQNVQTARHQPVLNARTSTSTLSAVGGRTTQATPPSSYPMVVRDERDFSLALSIQAAQGDKRECSWYGVWSKVLERYIFRDADRSRTACTCVPQYSLVASHDSGRLPQSGNSGLSDISMGSPSPDWRLMTPGNLLPGPPSVPHNPTPCSSTQSQAIFGGPLPPLTPSPLLPAFSHCVPRPESPVEQRVTRLRLQARHTKDASSLPVGTRPLPRSPSSYQIPSSGIPPKTPPRSTTGMSDASSRVPDFVQILEHAQHTFPVIPGHVIRRMIMTVEIKPEPCNGEKFNWESLWEVQVREQALHAFEADLQLQYLGVIMAAGRHWVYGTVVRGKLVPRTMSEMRDPTFPGIRLPVSSSNNSMVEDRPENHHFFPELKRPDFLPKTDNGTLYQFHLMDARGESLRAFKEILNDLRHHNRDIWV